MENERFVALLTKELAEGLSVAEKQELDLLVKQNAKLKQQRALIKDYWKGGRVSHEKNAANFSKLMDAIHMAEQTAVDNITPVPYDDKKPAKLWPAFKYLSAAMVLIAAVYLWRLSATKGVANILSSNWENKVIAPGVKERLVLPDGTVVMLNSGTTFKYPISFDGKYREVFLNGEAYFKVHKDALHPFIIHTKKMNVRVLGTVFNVKSYDDEPRSETSLIEGSIELTLNDRASDRIILKPREKLVVENDQSAENKTNIPGSDHLNAAARGTQYSLTNITYLPNIDSAAVETLWLKNKLVFRNEDFESIAADLDRWYGIKIVFEHEELKNLRFTATFEKESAVQVLESLRLTEAFHFRKNGSKFYILK